jgi:hypothetical protein
MILDPFVQGPLGPERTKHVPKLACFVEFEARIWKAFLLDVLDGSQCALNMVLVSVL